MSTTDKKSPESLQNSAGLKIYISATSLGSEPAMKFDPASKSKKRDVTKDGAELYSVMIEELETVEFDGKKLPTRTYKKIKSLIPIPAGVFVAEVLAFHIVTNGRVSTYYRILNLRK